MWFPCPLLPLTFPDAERWARGTLLRVKCQVLLGECWWQCHDALQQDSSQTSGKREPAPLSGLSWCVGAAGPRVLPPQPGLEVLWDSRVGSRDTLGVGTACDMFWRGQGKALYTLIFFARSFRDLAIKLQICVSVNTSGEKKKKH